MTKNRLIFLLIITMISIFYSCDKNYKITTYYESGELKEILEFKNKKAMIDSTDFYYLSFYKNGKLRSTKTIRNNTINGIEKKYTIDGKLTTEDYYVNDTCIYKMIAVKENDGFTNQYYYLRDSLEEVGVISFDSNYKIVKKESFYYTITFHDTIQHGSYQEFDFETYTFDIDNQIDSIVFGSFDSRFYFSPKEKFVEKDNNNSAKVIFMPKTKGYNSVSGAIYISSYFNEDSLHREFIFFEDFYVN